MSTKAEALRDPASCLNRVGPQEPIFVLRAKDPHAAQTIRLWAAMSVITQPPQKLEAAYDIAAQFQGWYDANVPQDIAAVASAQQRTYGPVDTAPAFLRKN
jgi:hypothetical protein